jgi:uncharacterized lipoprotein YehR (DUF1307 family)
MDLDDEFDSLFDDDTSEPEKPEKSEKKPKKEEEPEPKEEKTPEKKDSPKEKKEPKATGDTPQKPKKEETPKTKSYTTEDGYDISPDDKTEKAVVMIYAKKGEGKTYNAFTMPGKKVCISFDRKSKRIAAQPDFKDEDIIVYDGIRYYDKSDSDKWLESSTKSWKYLRKIFDQIENVDKPDWVIVDGGEILHKMFEMVMRDRNNIRPFQGVSNKNLWKYRRMLIAQTLSRCVDIANIGVIWTSYISYDKIIEDGDFTSIEEVPSWIDAVLYETDTVIRVSRSSSKNGQRFYATVESSKWPEMKESPKIDITGAGIKKLLKEDFEERIL